ALPIFETAVGTEVAPARTIRRFPQVDRVVLGLGTVDLLGVEARLREVSVEDSRGDGVPGEGESGTGPDPVFAPARVGGGVEDGAGGHLGLVDRGNALRGFRQPAQDPIELRG